MIKRCKACKKYHCPSCSNIMDDNFYCQTCETQFVGTEIIEPIDIDFTELYA